MRATPVRIAWAAQLPALPETQEYHEKIVRLAGGGDCTFLTIAVQTPKNEDLSSTEVTIVIDPLRAAQFGPPAVNSVLVSRVSSDFSSAANLNRLYYAKHTGTSLRIPVDLSAAYVSPVLCLCHLLLSTLFRLFALRDRFFFGCLWVLVFF